MEMPHLLDIQTRAFEALLRPTPPRRARGRRPRARLQGPVPDHGRPRELLAGVRPLHARRAEVLRRGVHRARHDLLGAAQGDAAARHLRGGRGAEAPANIIEKEVYLGELPLLTAARHLRHQRRRARHRQPAAPLAGRRVRGVHAPERPAPDLRAHHPVPRVVGRVHRRHPRRHLRPHRQEEEVPGHRAAARVRLRGQRRHPAALLRRAGARPHRQARRPAGEARGHRRSLVSVDEAEPRGSAKGEPLARPWATSSRRSGSTRCAARA